jgi:hypothetical protein
MHQVLEQQAQMFSLALSLELQEEWEQSEGRLRTWTRYGLPLHPAGAAASCLAALTHAGSDCKQRGSRCSGCGQPLTTSCLRVCLAATHGLGHLHPSLHPPLRASADSVLKMYVVDQALPFHQLSPGGLLEGQ